MPPSVVWSSSLSPFTRRDVSQLQPSLFAAKTQWQNPNDILTYLMIIGGDIVQCAIAQLAGGPPLIFGISLAPVAFSFGWVAYAFNAIVSAVGDRHLMPPPDFSITVINVKSGYARTNQSWVLGRLLRDYRRPREHQHHHGLAISFFRVSATTTPCSPARDWVYWSGVAAIVLQLGISVIPGAIWGNWMVLIITAGGTLLALAGSALPQWQREKWAARRIGNNQREVACLTSGNGSHSAMVIISDGIGVKLEDLAAGREVHGWAAKVTLYASFVLAGLWIVHLITVKSLAEDAWYSLLVGAIGMLQNALAAGARRSPEAMGFHLEDVGVAYDPKVFKALVKAEEIESQTGLCLLPIFFPGGLHKHEEAWRDERLAQYAKEKAENALGEEKVLLSETDRTTILTPTKTTEKFHEMSEDEGTETVGHDSTEAAEKVKVGPERSEKGSPERSEEGSPERSDIADRKIVNDAAAEVPKKAPDRIEDYTWREKRMASYAEATLVNPIATIPPADQQNSPATPAVDDLKAL
ncbi:hypothetical protein BKA93DRAFT_830681 [Sparassis latifolia]|uniref:Uncharacterized protein n=1 Tax=Sparassis crispa TaxID=139825 RepID=A0A401GUL5_9APHY|nr:hypothetical protein SCP_0804510 [Sparassis crispa]GBE85927.1 hypothetical protein SCP_0804510 [Sparassis crispa]